MGKNDSSGALFAAWPIGLRHSRRTTNDVPSAIVTCPASITHYDMPPEVAILLPTNAGPRAFVDEIVKQPTWDPSIAVGLFMSDPFLAATHKAQRLISVGVEWVCNMPTVEQQDEEFTQQLTDVGLDCSREFSVLAAFKAKGMKLVVAVSSGDGVRAAARLEPDVFAVLPRVSDFAAGFPSPRQRGAAAQNVREALAEFNFQGTLLGYGDEREIDHESQWPDAVDGMMFRTKD